MVAACKQRRAGPATRPSKQEALEKRNEATVFVTVALRSWRLAVSRRPDSGAAIKRSGVAQPAQRAGARPEREMAAVGQEQSVNGGADFRV